ncbi:Zn-ribbon domain-containing OB-fold protein [Nocardia salmonicida]|jgi:uncharacterized OB-fold protein|uniref:Zn-ribbon domain-containing OB-fold protein n=1 Tax=Nocardia salmonicida TaxID=53431 RepID=UPI0033E9472B
MPNEVPIVNYLVLDNGEPHLRATECAACGARYLGTRLACAKCSSRTFVDRELPKTGRIGSFSIIHRAAPGVTTPFASAIVNLTDGTAVKTNIVDCPPDPEHIELGMAVVLRTYEAGRDSAGTAAVAFGFAPADEPRARTTQKEDDR